MAAVRVCVFEMPAMFKVMREEGNPHEDVFFSGPAEVFMSNMLSLLVPGLNASIIQKNSTENCVESMERNESDILASTIPYVGHDFDIIYPVSLLDDMKIAIFSAYNMSAPDSKHFSDIAKSVLLGLSPAV